MKNYYKPNEIQIAGGKHGFFQEDGRITTGRNDDIFCGTCCKANGLRPSKSNTEDTAKAKELGFGLYINEDHTKIVCANCGREIIIEENFETMEEKVAEANAKALADLHIIEVAHSWETGIHYYGLSTRIDYEDWLKVKHLFHYHTASMDVDDEFVGQPPRGWVCRNYHEVEKILGIPAERQYDVRTKKAQEEWNMKVDETVAIQNIIRELRYVFFNDGEYVRGFQEIHGEVVEDAIDPLKQHQSVFKMNEGNCFVICEDELWFIEANGYEQATFGDLTNNVKVKAFYNCGEKVAFLEGVGRRLTYDETIADKIHLITAKVDEFTEKWGRKPLCIYDC